MWASVRGQGFRVSCFWLWLFWLGCCCSGKRANQPVIYLSPPSHWQLSISLDSEERDLILHCLIPWSLSPRLLPVPFALVAGQKGRSWLSPRTGSLLLLHRENPLTSWASTSPSRSSWFMFLGSALGHWGFFSCWFPAAAGIVKKAMVVLAQTGEVINNSVSCFPQGTEIKKVAVAA